MKHRIPYKTEIPTVEELIAESVKLNARPWAEVRAGYQALGVLTNDGEGGGGDGGGAGGDGGEDPAGGGGGGGDDDKVTLTKAEYDNLQRQNRESREKAEKMERDEAERQRKADEEAGNYKELAEREKARADAAEQEKEKIAAERLTEVRERRVEKIARRLKFKDPSDVMHRISDDVLDDDSKVEKALKDIAKEKQYLVEGGDAPRTRDVTGGDGGGEEAVVAGPSRLARAYGNSSSS